MSTKHIISPGIGFSPGSIKYIVTRGLLASGVLTLGGQRSTFAKFKDSRDYAEYQEKRAFVYRKVKRSFDDG